MRRALFAAPLLLLLGAAPPKAGDRPVDVFAKLDGTWKGTFVGYDPTGKELYRIQVTQTYETIDDNTQTVTIRDVDGKGKVTTGKGKNEARRTKDGLQLKCIVDKDNGDHVEHDGRLVKGASGDTQLVWSSVKPGRVETFREVVRADKGGDVYSIDGMGQYGDTLILMHGRYARVK